MRHMPAMPAHAAVAAPNKGKLLPPSLRHARRRREECCRVITTVVQATQQKMMISCAMLHPPTPTQRQTTHRGNRWLNSLTLWTPGFQNHSAERNRVLIQKLFPNSLCKSSPAVFLHYPRSSRRPTTAGAKVHQRYLRDAFPVRCGRPVYLPYTSTSISTDYVPRGPSPIPNSLSSTNERRCVVMSQQAAPGGRGTPGDSPHHAVEHLGLHARGRVLTSPDGDRRCSTLRNASPAHRIRYTVQT